MSVDLMDKIVSLAKRRGFAFQDSEIYGGLANTYSYGPLGTELMRNIRNEWWDRFVRNREDMFGIETPVIMNPKVWEASGHTSGFSDAMIECKECHVRTRADHLIENKLEDTKVEGLKQSALDNLIQEHEIHCPNCGSFNWTPAREFNLLFETSIGIIPESESKAYLRGETAQGMFANFKQIVDQMSPKLPFGIAQIGKAFRNEITKGQFVFRTLEFEQMEIEYFVREEDWEETYAQWENLMWEWLVDLGIDESNLRWRQHTDDELSHYSKLTKDIEYNFPFGYKELYGLAYRTDYDLKNHAEQSGVDLKYFDHESEMKFFPHVIEPTFGLNRTFLTLLLDSYREEDDRSWLSLDPKIAPYKVAVFPLVRNKDEIVNKAREVFELLQPNFNTVWDDRGNIGKRYYSQDEIGTPWCITVDYNSLDDNSVTIRDRDTTEQIRIPIDSLVNHFQEKLQ